MVALRFQVLILIAICFLSSESFRLSIIAGQRSDIKDFPYQFAFMYRDTFMCGGSIISRKFGLTAGETKRKIYKYLKRTVADETFSPLHNDDRQYCAQNWINEP